MGNREAKALISMTHGSELRWGNDGGRIKGRKKWDNCNSVFNKIKKKENNYLKYIETVD